MADLLFKEESFKVIGICMEIHKTLGMGLKEINYKDAIEMEFLENEIPLEIKSTATLIPAHFAQALSYLSVSNQRLALVINFGEKSLVWKRIVK
jgi:hypothetical protein